MDACCIPVFQFMTAWLFVRLCLFCMKPQNAMPIQPRLVAPYRDDTLIRLERTEAECRRLRKENERLLVSSSSTAFREWVTFFAASVGLIFVGVLVLKPENPAPIPAIPADTPMTYPALPDQLLAEYPAKRRSLRLVLATWQWPRIQRRWTCVGY